MKADTIELTVAGLNSANRRARDAEEREMEYAALVAEVMHLVTLRLQEAELPLHVLLSSPFGSLNENQEEMLTVAQSALGAADTEVRRLTTLLALDRGTVTATRRPVRLAEVFKPTLAMVEARGRSTQVTIRVDISETAPRLIVDPMQVQAAVTTLLTNVVMQASPGAEITITAREGESDCVRVVVRYGGGRKLSDENPLDLRLVHRLIRLQQGTLHEVPGQIVVELPSEAPVRVRRA